MKHILTLEFVSLFIFSIFLFSLLPYPWWWFPLLFLVPDVSMIGYLFNTRIGATTYNLIHTLTTGVLIYLLGTYLHAPLAILAGVILIAHSTFDRFMGYGLKYPDSFKHTHLGNL